MSLLTHLLRWFISFIPAVLITLIVLYLTYKLLTRWLHVRGVRQQKGEFTIGFFHPFCNSGGGGERVLWQYVRALQMNDPKQRILIYTGDTEKGEEILKKAHDRFNLPPIPNCVPIEFIRLRGRKLVTAELYPRFTMFGQSFGSMLLAVEALWKATPSVFVDTTGYAFSYPIARYLFGCSGVHCYTHYPTISSDMLQLVFERRESYNNSTAVSGSLWKARAKWIYYKIFALLYSLAGRAANLIFVNSNWTAEHINAIWQRKEHTYVVFPPCDTEALRSIPLGKITQTSEGTVTKASTSAAGGSTPIRSNLIISIGQFRPEKDHSLQLRSFALFLERLRELEQACPSQAERALSRDVKLVLIGGVRDAGDEARVAALRQLATELGISEQVDFQTNVPFPELKLWLGRAMAGLHTMWNEHFGIGVVEFMAAGVIPIAHNSGGPKSDILTPLGPQQRVGFLAATEEEYAQAMIEIFTGDFRGSTEMQEMRVSARKKAGEYSDEVFMEQLKKHFLPFTRDAQKLFEKGFGAKNDGANRTKKQR